MKIFNHEINVPKLNTMWKPVKEFFSTIRSKLPSFHKEPTIPKSNTPDSVTVPAQATTNNSITVQRTPTLSQERSIYLYHTGRLDSLQGDEKSSGNILVNYNKQLALLKKIITEDLDIADTTRDKLFKQCHRIFNHNHFLYKRKNGEEHNQLMDTVEKLRAAEAQLEKLKKSVRDSSNTISELEIANRINLTKRNKLQKENEELTNIIKSNPKQEEYLKLQEANDKLQNKVSLLSSHTAEIDKLRKENLDWQNLQKEFNKQLTDQKQLIQKLNEENTSQEEENAAFREQLEENSLAITNAQLEKDKKQLVEILKDPTVAKLILDQRYLDQEETEFVQQAIEILEK